MIERFIASLEVENICHNNQEEITKLTLLTINPAIT
jgi:hypothetical protein